MVKYESFSDSFDPLVLTYEVTKKIYFYVAIKTIKQNACLIDIIVIGQKTSNNFLFLTSGYR